MLQDIMPGTAEQLSKEMTSGYIGFDPTADSLHIGSLVPILLLAHLQKAGHKPIAILGGATGLVGDPSGKSEERNLLDEATLNHNLICIRKQLEKYLDFSPTIPNTAEIVNNFDWFREIHFVDFIRDVGKHITVNYMMAKDSVRKRLEGTTGMSFTEFSYQLVQGYDFLWLYQNRNCKLQMGGSDQWGNITTGAELIRRISGEGAFAFTCPLLTKDDGTKFGKTEKGNIWLDPAKTSPYHFYQFWLNATDADAEKWIRIFTFLDRDEISFLVKAHQKNPSERLLQKSLAKEITIFIHGHAEYEGALTTTEKLFKPSGGVEMLTEQDLHELAGIVKSTYAITELKQGVDVVRFLAESGILPSKSEARKLVQNGGITINRNKVEDIQFKIGAHLLLHAKYILVQKGKKNFYLVEAK
jgi:tyrosyl-tRNA synthetase